MLIGDGGDWSRRRMRIHHRHSLHKPRDLAMQAFPSTNVYNAPSRREGLREAPHRAHHQEHRNLGHRHCYMRKLPSNSNRIVERRLPRQEKIRFKSTLWDYGASFKSPLATHSFTTDINHHVCLLCDFKMQGTVPPSDYEDLSSDTLSTLETNRSP